MTSTDNERARFHANAMLESTWEFDAIEDAKHKALENYLSLRINPLHLKSGDVLVIRGPDGEWMREAAHELRRYLDPSILVMLCRPDHQVEAKDAEAAHKESI